MFRGSQGVLSASPKVRKGIDNVLDLIGKGALSQEDAARKLGEWNDRRQHLQEELAQLADVPDAEAMQLYVDTIEDEIGRHIIVYDDGGNPRPEYGNSLGAFLAMTPQDRRVLVESVFGAPLPDGAPAGIYIAPDGEPNGPKAYTFEIKGQLAWRVTPRRMSQLRFAGHHTPVNFP
jgi:hypothetical protein